MFSDSAFTDAWSRLPDYLGQHVLVSLTALLLGLAVSFPLSLYAVRRPHLRTALLAVASVVQTIPGLALLALFYPLLLGIASLTAEYFGFDFSALGNRIINRGSLRANCGAVARVFNVATGEGLRLALDLHGRSHLKS